MKSRKVYLTLPGYGTIRLFQAKNLAKTHSQAAIRELAAKEVAKYKALKRKTKIK